MPFADELYLTEVDNTPEAADAFFPEWRNEEWREISSEQHSKDEKHAFDFSFTTYAKNK